MSSSQDLIRDKLREMQAEMTVFRLLAEARSIAFVTEFSGNGTAGVAAYMQGHGYRIAAVMPRAHGEFLGEPAAQSLQDLEEHVDIVTVCLKDLSMEIAQDAIAAGVGALWFQPGTGSAEARRLAQAAGLTVVAGRCLQAVHEELGRERGVPW